MAEKSKQGKGEKKKPLEAISRFGRDFNIVVGSVALVGAFIAPPVAAAGLTAYAGLNYVQAGGFEVARRFAKNRNKNRKDKIQKNN